MNRLLKIVNLSKFWFHSKTKIQCVRLNMIIEVQIKIVVVALKKSDTKKLSKMWSAFFLTKKSTEMLNFRAHTKHIITKHIKTKPIKSMHIKTEHIRLLNISNQNIKKTLKLYSS